MRRIAIYVSDDILMEEVLVMAKNAGFHVRHVNGMTVMDRVPRFLHATESSSNVIPLRKGPR